MEASRKHLLPSASGAYNVHGREVMNPRVLRSKTTQILDCAPSGMPTGSAIRRGVIAGIAATGLALCPSAAAAGDANVGTCANEHVSGFRGYLPDCRAYEMVTPVYTQGYPLEVSAIAGAGSSIQALSWGVFAGAQSAPQVRNSDGTEYQLSRAADGLAATPLAPPSFMYLGASTWYGASPNLSKSIWSMPTPPVEQDDFYVRQPSGEFTTVGPVTNPVAGPSSPPAAQSAGLELSDLNFQGASEDTTHIVYSILVHKGDVWTGDGTAEDHESLYEYTGPEQSEPQMVGVIGGAGSRELIGECGVNLGGPASKFNALSAQGTVVYFTPASEDEGICGEPQPAVSELYARINTERTVRISERSPSTCSTVACLGSPAGDALFEGASRDGSKVFFTGTQQLTDQATEDANSEDSAVREGCPEAHESGCNLYEYDFDLPPGENLRAISAGSTLPHVQGVLRISETGSHIYFVATGVLTDKPRGGQESEGKLGPCLRELSVSELAEEADHEGKCRPKAGADNLYLYERDPAVPSGKVSFVGTLSPGDSEVWGRNANLDGRRRAETTPDGRFLVFDSKADLTTDDSSSVSQVFEYDAQTGALLRVSKGAGGFNDNGNTSSDPATIPHPFYLTGDGGAEPQPLAVSSDGSEVVFQSADGLTPQALNDVTINELGEKANNIYEYHAGEVFLISDGHDTTIAGNGTGSIVDLLGMSEGGQDILFTSGDQLVPQDVDTQQIVYDARSDGGFQSPVEAMQCREACGSGTVTAPPNLAGANSEGVQADDIPVASFPAAKAGTKRAATKAEKLASALQKCRNGRRRERVRCEQRARRSYGHVSMTGTRRPRGAGQ